MASSEENPASAAPESKNGADGSEKTDSSGKPKKKTLIGLGKLRESLKKSSSGKKSTSLRIPKPPSPKKKKKKTQLGLPRPQTQQPQTQQPQTPQEAPEDDGPPTDRVEEVPEETFDDHEPETDRLEGDELGDDGPNTDQMSADELAKSMPALEVPKAIAQAKAAKAAQGRSAGGDPADSSLIEDTRLDDPVDEPIEAEATMLSDSPFEQGSTPNFGAEPAASNADEFEAEATMVTDSPLDSPPQESADDDFGAEATMVTDSPLEDPAADSEFDGGDKTTVSSPSSDSFPVSSAGSVSSKVPARQADESSARERRQTNPNPPTPEQTPRSGEYAIPAVSRTQDAQVEAELPADASDDDFSAVKTEVFDSPYENEALVARLSVLSGPAAGQEFLLNKQRNTIGRGKNNTIMVSDLAMSRQHFEILENNDQSYLLVDLQSANGSRLNSTRIEEAELFHGDRIEAGKSEFQFVIPGAHAQPRNRNRHIIAKREVSTPETSGQTMVRQMGAEVSGDDTTDKILTYVIIGAGVLSLFLIGAAGFLFLNDPREGDQPTAEAAPAEDPAAQKLYLEGVEKVKDRDWDAARQTFERVGELDPEFPGVVAQLERVSREKKAERDLARAGELLTEDKDEQAAELAASISNDSVYFEDAQALVRKTRQRRVAELYQMAQEAVTDEKPEEAQKHLAAILEEVPNHKAALELQKTLTEGESADEEETSEEQESNERPSSARPAPRRSNDDWLSSSGSSSSRTGSSSGTRINFTKGFSLYKSGKFDKAASYFRNAASGSSGALATRATTTAKNIDRFEGTYSRASRAFDAGAWKTAIDGFEDAKRADRKVARSGYFKSDINGKLATAHAKIGLGEFAKGNYAGANRHFTKGRRYSNSNSTVNTLRRKLSTTARNLYIQAANKKKTDPAKAGQLCRQIMSMVPSSHLMHQKAKKMLAEL